MAHLQFVDELVKEYLLFRGFASTVKNFDVDLKIDKEKGFRVDKIVEQLLQFINNYDLNSLRDFWGHLDSRMFSKLESQFTPAVRKLEYAVLKLYLVNCVVNNKTEKLNEFFVKMTPELQNQSEWKDWFMLPYMKNPEENPIFKLHFMKQWQDTLLVSLHNFLATIFQCMPQPTLANFEEDAMKIKKLQEENEALRNRLTLLLDRGSDVIPCDVAPPAHLLDDFYIIAQENTSADNSAKTLKNLIRNISTNSSPILGRKEPANDGKKRTGSVSNKSMRST